METTEILDPATPPDAPTEEFRRALVEYQAILENASIGIAFTRGRRIERVNPRFEQMLGWPRGSLAGRDGAVVWESAEQYDEVRRRVAPRLALRMPAEFECAMARRDGGRFFARVRATAVDPRRPSDGGTIWTIEDVTEQRRSFESLERAQDELEARVRARTEELAATNERLRQEIVEREAAERRIHHLAHHDVLTGLPNRRLLESRLGEALAACAEQRSGLAVMFIDLDRFKPINDTLGHAVGDGLLQTVSKRLRETLRPTDTVSRVGGDEFVLVLPGISGRDEAADVARRLLDRLSRPSWVRGHRLFVTPSIGISLHPDDAADAASLLAQADAAMYQAKAQGRRSYEFHDPRRSRRDSPRFDLEADLHAAVRQSSLALHYQARFDLATGALCATEALARWRHPQRGIVPPSVFIPAAEETGLIHAIGEWSLREACRQHRRWRARGLAAPRIAVNLSSSQLRRRGFVELLETIVREERLERGMLEIEITEAALAHDPDEAQEILERIAAMGVSISIDDFGTGYSNLASLKRFPIDALKIDQSFVQGLGRDVDDEAIVRAITGLATSFGKRVIAEGIESEAQAAFLREIRCGEGQGFLFGPPQPPEAFEARLLTSAA